MIMIGTVHFPISMLKILLCFVSLVQFPAQAFLLPTKYYPDRVVPAWEERPAAGFTNHMTALIEHRKRFVHWNLSTNPYV